MDLNVCYSLTLQLFLNLNWQWADQRSQKQIQSHWNARLHPLFLCLSVLSTLPLEQLLKNCPAWRHWQQPNCWRWQISNHLLLLNWTVCTQPTLEHQTLHLVTFPASSFKVSGFSTDYWWHLNAESTQVTHAFSMLLMFTDIILMLINASILQLLFHLNSSLIHWWSQRQTQSHSAVRILHLFLCLNVIYSSMLTITVQMSFFLFHIITYWYTTLTTDVLCCNVSVFVDLKVGLRTTDLTTFIPGDRIDQGILHLQ